MRSDETFRVLQLLPALGDGGVERSTVEMAEYLAARGIDQWVVSAGGRLEADVVAIGAHTVTMPVNRKSPLAMLANARALGQLIDRKGIDIVHARSRAPAWVGWLACRYFARRRCRFLTTFHGVYGHGFALKRSYNRVMLYGDIAIANSQFIRDHIVSVYGYPQDQIIVAPRGIDPLQFDPIAVSQIERKAIRKSFSVGDGVPLLMMVGRLTGWKGHAILIDALARLVHRPWSAVFVGGGAPEFVADLEQHVAAAGLGGRIHLAGSRSDVPALLASADLAFSTSTRPEAFGRASIEAQAMETPIIATDHGGSRETVVPGQTGWLVPPADVQSLADTIDQALSNADRLQDIGKRGRAHVLAHFTTQQMLDQEFSAYGRVLARKD